MVDLYLEDTYLAGLVDTHVATGKLPGEEIVLDDSIDARLWAARTEDDAARQARGDFLRYRAAMRRLADLLNDARRRHLDASASPAGAIAAGQSDAASGPHAWHGSRIAADHFPPWKPRDVAFLRRLVLGRAPDRLDALRDDDPQRWSPETRERVGDLLWEEFCEVGLGADDEPNEMGRYLDELMGWVSLVGDEP